jgi:lysophospholipase L1-like esterase
MCRELGWDARVNGSGGSGYMANGNGGKFSLRIGELIAQNPDVFVFAGGYNDGASSTASIAAEFETLVNQVRTALPDCVILSVGPWTPEISATHPTVTRVRINKALRDKAAELDVPYIAPLEWPVITGEWAVSGSGNAPEFITANNIHPTIQGYEAIGRWIASQIAIKLSGRAQYPDELRVLDAPTPSWTTFGTVAQSTVTHDGVTNAVMVTVTNTTGHNIYTTPMLASHIGYNARKVRTRLKMKVASGSVLLATDTPIITGRFAHPFRVRSRPLNGAWTELDIPTLSLAGHLYVPWTTANSATWTEWEIESAWSNRLVGLYSQATADPNTVYYVKDVTVDVLED